jgi:hypothetical protein
VMKKGEAIINQVSQALADTNTLAFGADIFSRSQTPQRVCDKLNTHSLLQSQGLVAHCPDAVSGLPLELRIGENSATAATSVRAVHVEDAERLERQSLWARDNTTTAPGTNSSGGPVVDDSADYVIPFQMLFWTSLILFVLFLYGAGSIAELGIPNDSQLLRNLPDIYKPLGTQVMRELGDQ